ncbi:hypothetical protein XCR_1021 [Xanthomonas campestris pv. raphani 756C]|nr:hypothetical protein XCR_1021 [Xanthomonas campestris pv. raphani 756C]
MALRAGTQLGVESVLQGSCLLDSANRTAAACAGITPQRAATAPA